MNSFISYHSGSYDDDDDEYDDDEYDEIKSLIRDPNSKLFKNLQTQSDRGSSYIYGKVDACKQLASLLNAKFSGNFIFACDKDILKIFTLSKTL